MTQRQFFWFHFFLCLLISWLLLRLHPSFFLSPWITFQVHLMKKSSPLKGLIFQFFLGLAYSGLSSSLKIGTYSLVLCLNYLTLLPLKRAFIDDQLLASSLFSALFGLLFSLGEFFLYQIFFSDIPFSIGKISWHFLLKLGLDFFFSLAIFSWLYFVNFSILKMNQILKEIKEKKELKRHAS